MLKAKKPKETVAFADPLTRTVIIENERRDHEAEKNALLDTIKEHKKLGKKLDALNTKLTTANEQLTSADLEKNALMDSIAQFKRTLLALEEALSLKNQEFEALGLTIQERKSELATLTAQVRLKETKTAALTVQAEPPKPAEKRKTRFTLFSCCITTPENNDPASNTKKNTAFTNLQ